MSQQISKIQGLRGIAILLIVFWHLNDIFPNNLPTTGDKGVEFFFLISGFLVASKYYISDALNNLHKSFFYTFNKIKKIYIHYIIFAIPGIIILFVNFKDDCNFASLAMKIISYLGVFQSWIPNSDYYWGINGVMWFLSSIAFCYFITPVLFKIIKKIPKSFAPLFLLALQYLIEVVSFSLFSYDVATYITYICPLYRCLDYALGIIVFIEISDNNISQNKGNNLFLLLTFSMYIGLMCIADSQISYSGYRIFEYLIFYMFITSSSDLLKTVFEKGILKKIGDISMIIFITHLPIKQVLDKVWKLFFDDNYQIIEWLIIFFVILSFAFFYEIIIKFLRREHEKSKKNNT